MARSVTLMVLAIDPVSMQVSNQERSLRTDLAIGKERSSLRSESQSNLVKMVLVKIQRPMA